ncbi:mono-ADP-ribosyltransferase PARP12-like 6 [Homarus americanus]|uniref:Poly [ADP-ribose] polymerase n=1 Tax=Homarus americanus TaxID=6706 RepID=A0A8J5N5M9_HOMAM|nr:mono-ADP-ribosyltransferase PARP12-like 6 [Homarus americanus]
MSSFSGARQKQHYNNSRGRGRQRSSHSKNRESPPEYRRQRKTSNQRITSWSYYHEGDVEIPEICVYSIDKRCMYEDTGCLRLHAKCTCQWQVIQDGKWFNFRNFHSEELENAFLDVTKDSVKITPLDPKLLGSSGRDMIKILGNGQWEADFENLTLKNLTSQSILTSKLFIRRLSTQSAAVSKSGKATKYEWYFCDSKKKWIKYGDVDSLGHNHLVPLITSDEIELNFSSDSSVQMMFNNSLYRYQLDFKTMKQKNLNTGKERSVRRRPVKKQSTKPNPRGKKENLPSTWDSMKDNDTMIKVSLDVSSQEYCDVMSQLLITVPAARVVSIMRIQNPFLWRPFQNKQAELAIKYDGYEKLNIQKLFHGTRHEFIDDICKKNFDWRLHGSMLLTLLNMQNKTPLATAFCSWLK